MASLLGCFNVFGCHWGSPYGKSVRCYADDVYIPRLVPGPWNWQVRTLGLGMSCMPGKNLFCTGKRHLCRLSSMLIRYALVPGMHCSVQDTSSMTGVLFSSAGTRAPPLHVSKARARVTPGAVQRTIIRLCATSWTACTLTCSLTSPGRRSVFALSDRRGTPGS